MDAQWTAWLDSLPSEAVAARTALLERAASIAPKFRPPSFPAEIDVVVAGSGFLALYYLGVQMVLSALEVKQQLTTHRYAGASSGAQTPFQLILSGLESTLDTHLALGLLYERFAPSAWQLTAVSYNDKLWNIVLRDHMLAKHQEHLGRLDDRVFVSVAQLHWWGPKHVRYSKFSPAATGDADASAVPSVTREAFHATGTALTRCEGYLATDGGMVAMCPSFEDRRHAQLLVKPLKAGLSLLLVNKFTLAAAVAAIERGQDDAVAFIAAGGEAQAGRGGALTLLRPAAAPGASASDVQPEVQPEVGTQMQPSAP